MDSRSNILVIGLGQTCVDYIGRINNYPKEDEKSELLDLKKGFGGPAATAMVTLARFGIATSFLGSVSNDEFGQGMVENLKRENVDTSQLKIQDGHSSQFAFIAVTKDSAKRTIFWHRGTSPQLEPEDVDLSIFTGAKALLVDGLMIRASVEAAIQARKKGMQVIMDAGTFREGSGELMNHIDILIASEHFADPIMGKNADHEKALRFLMDFGPKTVIITLGEKGSIGVHGDQVFFQDAIPVSPIDTTGAGDVYHGAYIYGLLQDWRMQTCMRFASAAAALNCKSTGAQNGIPRLADVFKILSGN